ncbi:methyltransferase [bacterium]|nr:methyltransferase [bacterium]
MKISIPELGMLAVPQEFKHLFTEESELMVRRAEQSRPSEVLNALAQGQIVVLVGKFAYLNGIMRFVHRHDNVLAPKPAELPGSNRYQRSRVREQQKRNNIARLMVAVEGGRLVGVTDYPECDGLTDWLNITEFDPNREPFLMPLRRFFRILTDMKRQQEGIFMQAIGDSITVLPHVYVPSDQSVIDLLAENLILEGNSDARSVDEIRVLDMGTGTGILGFVAAKHGATKVILTDISPNAVENARLNIQRLGLQQTTEVRGPADLFDSVKGEIFDIIIFNPPWILGEPKTLYDEAIYDKEQQIITRFLSQVNEYLSPRGRLLLIYSDISQSTGEGSLDKLNELLKQNRLEIVSQWQKTRRSHALGGRERVYLFEIFRIAEV